MQIDAALNFFLNSKFSITVVAGNTSLAEAKVHYETQLIHCPFGKLSQQFSDDTKR